MSDATPDRYEWLLAKHLCAFADYVDAHRVLAVGWPRLYPPMSDEWVSDTIDAIAEGVALMAGSDANSDRRDCDRDRTTKTNAASCATSGVRTMSAARCE